MRTATADRACMVALVVPHDRRRPCAIRAQIARAQRAVAVAVRSSISFLPALAGPPCLPPHRCAMRNRGAPRAVLTGFSSTPCASTWRWQCRALFRACKAWLRSVRANERSSCQGEGNFQAALANPDRADRRARRGRNVFRFTDRCFRNDAPPKGSRSVPATRF